MKQNVISDIFHLVHNVLILSLQNPLLLPGGRAFVGHIPALVVDVSCVAPCVHDFVFWLHQFLVLQPVSDLEQIGVDIDLRPVDGFLYCCVPLRLLGGQDVFVSCVFHLQGYFPFFAWLSIRVPVVLVHCIVDSPILN